MKNNYLIPRVHWIFVLLIFLIGFDASALTLQDAIETALENNPGLSVRRYETSASAARQSMALSDRLPHLNLQGSITQYHEDRLMAPRRPGGADTLQFTDQPLAGEAVVQMPLFTGGRLLNKSRAAKLLHDASEHRFARSREELVFQVTSVFYSILAQRHTIEALEFSQGALQEHCNRIHELIRAQKAAQVDLLRTEVRLSDLKQQLTREKNILAIQTRQLTNLTGVPYAPAEPPTIVGKLEPDDVPVPDIEQGLLQALSMRPDYLEALATLTAQDKNLRAAHALRSPSLTLKGAFGSVWDGDDTEQENQTGSIMLAIDLPVFSGGYISAQVREKRAIHSMALERLRQLELQIQLDVEIAVLNIGSSYERIQATQKSIEQAKESLRIEQEKYSYAKGSITDVFDAQSALLDAQMNYYRSLANYKIAQSQYQLATGDGNKN